MKQRINRYLLIILSWILVTTIGMLFIPLKVSAQDSYQVTFRAGNLGTVNSSTYYSVTAAVGTSLTDVITSNGIASLVSVKDATEYYVEPVAKWKINSETIGTKVVERNCDVVISYGRLIDSVEYVVKYLDIDTGVQVAEPLIERGGKGESFLVAPLTNIANYVLVSPVTNQTLVLSDGVVNEVVFYYRSTLLGTVTENIANQTIPGGTTTTTENVDNIINQPVALAAGPGGGAAAGDAVVIDEGGTPLAAEVPEVENNPSVNKGEESEQTIIGDADVPLIDNPVNKTIAPVIYGIAVSLMAVLIGVYFMIKRKLKFAQNNESEEEINEKEK